jgi:hypothetical protein
MIAAVAALTVLAFQLRGDGVDDLLSYVESFHHQFLAPLDAPLPPSSVARVTWTLEVELVDDLVAGNEQLSEFFPCGP